MKNTKTKILSLLLAVIMVMGLMPVSVEAVVAGSPDDLSLRGPIAVSGTTSNYQHIYYGGYRWRILEKSGTELFLLSETSVTARAFDDTTDGFKSNNYYSSSIRTWLNDDFYKNFKSEERSAINVNGNGDETYLLSINEINSYTYFPGGNVDRVLSAGGWWLCSPGTSYDADKLSGYAAQVLTDGSISSYGLKVDIPGCLVRPAFRLKLSSVLFTSPAASGASATTGSNLTAAAQPTGDLKLTIADSKQTLEIGAVTADNCTSGSAVTVNYSGAAASVSNYLCAELTSGGNTYRGVIKALKVAGESSTATFNLPADLTSGYTLKLWNEQYNAANITNYACTPVSKSITFSNPAIVTTSLTMGTVGTAYNAALAAVGGTAPYTWSVDSLPSGLSIDTAMGIISGTPTEAGTYTVKATVTDKSSTPVSVSKNLTLTVYATSSSSVPYITVANGVAFSVTLHNTGGKYAGAVTTTYGTITGTVSGSDTVLTGTLTSVPTTWTEVTLNGGKVMIRSVTSPSTTVTAPSFN